MSDSTDTPDNVLHVRFKRTPEDLPTAPVIKSPAKAERPFCPIHHFIYDRAEREVACSRCERKFDPFEAFEHLAQHWRNYDYNHRNARAEIAQLHKERDRVAKQVANLKAQRRRLVPNVRQDVDRVRSELWRHNSEKNPTIAKAIMQSIRARLDKIIHTIDTFGDAEEVSGA